MKKSFIIFVTLFSIGGPYQFPPKSPIGGVPGTERRFAATEFAVAIGGQGVPPTKP